MQRSLSSVLSVAILLVSAGAGAQDATTTPRTERDHAISIEVQARIGGGAMWVEGDRSVRGVPPNYRGGAEGAGHLGASISVREFGAGLGATLAYSHVFTGIGDTYGTHAIELRLSERFTFFRARRRTRVVELSVLAEVGPFVGVGGARDGCVVLCSDHVPSSVGVTTAGVVVALGLGVQLDTLLIGVEGDYRNVTGLDGPIVSGHELLALVRVGVVADL